MSKEQANGGWPHPDGVETSPRLLKVILFVLVLGGLLSVVQQVHQQQPPAEQSLHAFSFHETPRSGKWPAVRRAYLAEHPDCEACGRTEKQSGQVIEVHHVIPFSTDASQELNPDNLIALCRRCHELLGHLDKWSDSNPEVREDSARMLKKIKERK